MSKTKVIAVAAVSAGGKTATINEIKRRLPQIISLHFDDYTFEGQVDDFYRWVIDGVDYNVWNLEPLKRDILNILNSGKYDYLFLDYPFAYCNDLIAALIDYAIFIDTSLDIAMARRVLRDMQEATGDEIRNDMEIYLKYARIAYIAMLDNVLPSSDYVVDGNQTIDDIADNIINHII